MRISGFGEHESCYSDADALFVKMAGRAVHIGPSPSNESYLCIDKIIHAALATGADGNLIDV